MKSLVAAMTVTVVVGALIAALALFLGSLGGGESDSIDREPLTIVTSNGTTARLEVEIADSRAERRVGLSGREDLPMDTGMLFVMPEGGSGFWMRDTLVPLSIAFIERCGEILSIQDMQPLSLEVHDVDREYNFGLETPQGWFQANGVSVGDIVAIPRGHRHEGC